MTADDLKEAGRGLFPPDHGWQTRLADWLEVDASSVRRWVAGAVPVPGPVARALECALVIRDLGGYPADAGWRSLVSAAGS